MSGSITWVHIGDLHMDEAAWPFVQIVSPADIRMVTRPADPRQVPRPGKIEIVAKLFGGNTAEVALTIDDGPRSRRCPAWAPGCGPQPFPSTPGSIA